MDQLWEVALKILEIGGMDALPWFVIFYLLWSGNRRQKEQAAANVETAIALTMIAERIEGNHNP